jgi:hypothetical protein
VAVRYKLSVYRSAWLCRLERIRGSVRMSSVLQSVIHVVVMYVYKMIPNSSLVCPYRMLATSVLCSRLPCSCLLSKKCNTYADMGLFVLVYRMCSWCLIVIDLPVCPTNELLHVLHCSLYIPQQNVLVCGTLSRNCLYTVLFVYTSKHVGATH